MDNMENRGMEKKKKQQTMSCWSK